MKLREYNFINCLDYDYDRFNDCESHGCDYICRCSTIENAHVTKVDVSSLVNEIYSIYFDGSLSSKRNGVINSILGSISKEMDIYTIDRILIINKVYKSDSWDVNTSGGYYGEEIDSVTLDSSLSTKIENQLYEAFDIIDLDKRMEYLLKLEYGYILPELKNCSYQVDTIEKDRIIFGSDGQYRKVSVDNLEHYSEKNYFSYRGIVIPKGEGYRLIDGYHRCFASESKMIQVIIAHPEK